MKRLFIALLVSLALGKELAATCKVTKITQAMVPYSITHSGRYEVCEDLTSGGSAVITVSADNVQIFLNNHSITATAIKGVGISGAGHSELVIANDAISSNNQQGVGISLFNYEKVILKNLMTAGGLDGLQLVNCSDVLVDTCSFIGASTGAGINSSSLVTFENSLFKDNTVGLSFTASCRDCKILTCSFPSSKNQNLDARSIDGLLIKNSTFSGGDATSAGDMIALGRSGSANSVRIEGCTFISAGTYATIMHYISGAGLIVDSCLFDGPALPADGSLVLLDDTSQNIFIQGSTFNGNLASGSNGIFVNANNTVIQNSLIQNNGNDGIDILGNACTIRSCTVSNNGNTGIVAEGSGAAILDSTISNNTNFGIDIETSHNVAARNRVTQNGALAVRASNIYIAGSSNSIVSNTVTGGGNNGILLQFGTYNTVQYNTVHSNTGPGIFDDTAVNDGITNTTTQQIYFNTSYNNAPKSNYVGGLSTDSPMGPTFVLAQGDCTLEAANIDGAATQMTCT